MPTYQLIAALGSSFAAGPNIEPVVDRAAMRSGNNYAHQLADLLDAELVDLTVSGATTANVIDTPQQVAKGVSFPPQIDGVPADADVVTITAGGNDLQFAGAMLYSAWSHAEPDGQMASLLGQMFTDGIPAPTPAAVEQATSGLVSVIERVRQAAPAARIVLVDYLTVLDRDVTPAATTFTADELDRFFEIQDAIVRVFADAAARTGAELVRASAISTAHALGSVAPWVQPFHQDMQRTGGSFHPNGAGMAAIAVEIERLLNA
ncbi:SGNH/GDSL hydrolase family protein [Curtobacterium sp. AB7]|uniref:SGNH/GDSL hydrolase family protein n=1 Tax=Curtobacterium sp. AB7 TaxID=3349327 RepID=UPI00383938D8